MINNALKKMIEENILGLATADKLGNPHNIAVGHVKVVSESQLVISDNYLDETLCFNIKSIKVIEASSISLTIPSILATIKL